MHQMVQETAVFWIESGRHKRLEERGLGGGCKSYWGMVKEVRLGRPKPWILNLSPEALKSQLACLPFRLRAEYPKP